jgi:hypothetical protein
MTEDQGNLKRDHPKHRFAGGIGYGLGCATAFGVFKLIPFKSFWLGLVILLACSSLGGFLAQKIASKWR